ncbi:MULTISPECIES: hydroxymethylbilane synthase [Thermoanaerobacterium]|uniref:Porphobilinogen deaminase n=2 Tax=Thermoanaerobacterium TaxID=28895 RepID=W9EF15_9THEO|nr:MULTISPECIES: hydroxymethylbilane synthase [Thermoanaerobacterium]AFK86656.1 Porphobilinogen deaminase [Thermoanaerobacterium saccharolyticum JW/SL-YS485]ETO38329.1 porphobilinogen deaminase [Thermoanaerobacterium aotearoense SCUT27]
MKKIRVGTRGSELALTQTLIIINEIKKYKPDLKFEIVKITTKGDIVNEASLSEIGGKGLFIKEIEDALMNGEIDMAIHSMKDMPFEIPEGLKILPVFKREDPRDVFISRSDKFIDLKENAKVATSSLRRNVQIRSLRPDIDIVPIRGNIATRIRKMDELNLDGIVLAAAGIKRLGLDKLVKDYFPVDLVVPAPCQGILAVEIKEDFESEFFEIYPMLLDVKTFFESSAERKIMKKVGGNCKTPLGVYSEYKNNGNEELISILVSYYKDGKLLKIKETGLIKDIENISEIIVEKIGGL